MERTARAQIAAGIAMLVLCLLLGFIEAVLVLRHGSWAYFSVWLAVFVIYLGSILVSPYRAESLSRARVYLAFTVPALAGSAVVLLSPNPGGLTSILLVLTTATAALYIGLRGLAALITWHSLVLVAALLGLGPLGGSPASATEILIVTVAYVLIQAASAGMMWSQSRAEEALQKLTIAHVDLRSTSALLAESSQVQERLRISRDLHDVIGHQLTALALELEIASHHATGPAQEHVRRARGVAKDLLADVRHVVGTERRRAFDVTAALSDVVADVPRPRIHLEVDAELDGELDVPYDAAVALVRTAQEVTTNAIRHSGAENLWIHVGEADGIVFFEAHDDGLGSRRLVPGNGLRGIAERVENLDGDLHLDGSNGFWVRVEIPQRQVVAP